MRDDMKTLTSDRLTCAKTHITAWINELHVAGGRLGSTTRHELLSQLASACPITRHDGSVDFVLPALSSLGVGIFQRSFKVGATLFRVVPYGPAAVAPHPSATAAIPHPSYSMGTTNFTH